MIYKSLILTSLLISSSFSSELDESRKSIDDKLSLKSALDLSIKNDPWLQGNRYAQDVILAKTIVAGTYVDPKISIGTANIPTDSFDLNQEAMTQLKIGVSQMFPRGDSLEIKQKQLRLQSSSFPFQREDRKSKVSVKVAQLWLDAYKAQESIVLIKNNRFLFEQLVDIAESSYSSAFGKTRQQDIIRAQLELTKIDDRLTKLEQKKDIFLFSLSEWIYNFSEEEQFINQSLTNFNVTLSSQLPLISIINEESFNTNLDSNILISHFNNHPSIRNIEQKIKATKTNISLAKQMYKPQFALNTSYAFRDNDLKGNSRADLFSVGVTFDIPIFTKNRQDQNVQAAILQTKSVKTEKILKLRQMLSSYELTKNNLKRLYERDTLYKKELLPQTYEQAESSLTAYTNDDGDFAEVVRSRIAQLNAKIDALNISVEIKKNTINLNYLFLKKSQDILDSIHFKGDNNES